MLKERVLDAQIQLVSAANEDDIELLYEILEASVADPEFANYDFICYTFYRGNLVEVALYDREIEDFHSLMYYEEEDKE